METEKSFNEYSFLKNKYTKLKRKVDLLEEVSKMDIETIIENFQEGCELVMM